jgi:hypothetical protein
MFEARVGVVFMAPPIYDRSILAAGAVSYWSTLKESSFLFCSLRLSQNDRYTATSRFRLIFVGNYSKQ